MGADDCRDRFIERVAALTGRTTYRVPVGGRATGLILTDQDVAAAIAMGRRRHKDKTVDDTDCGPELVMDFHQQGRANKPTTTYRLERAVMRKLHMEQPHYRVARAVNAVYEMFMLGIEEPVPQGVPDHVWYTLCDVVLAILLDAYNEALPRMERALLRGV